MPTRILHCQRKPSIKYLMQRSIEGVMYGVVRELILIDAVEWCRVLISTACRYPNALHQCINEYSMVPGAKEKDEKGVRTSGIHVHELYASDLGWDDAEHQSVRGVRIWDTQR
jgi:hypothetical protein